MLSHSFKQQRGLNLIRPMHTVQLTHKTLGATKDLAAIQRVKEILSKHREKGFN
jgi:hypothetical protein